VPPRARVPDLDPDVETICLKCLQKAPGDRYAGAGELADDCARALAGEPLAARPVGKLERLWKKAKRNRRVAVPLAAMAVLLVGTAFWFGAGAVRHAWAARSLASELDAMLMAARLCPQDDRDGRARHLVAAESAAIRLRELEPEDLSAPPGLRGRDGAGLAVPLRPLRGTSRPRARPLRSPHR